VGAIVIEMIGGSSNGDTTGGDSYGVVLGKGGTSHGRGMRSSEEGAVFLVGSNGMFSGCWVAGTDVGKDGGSGTLTGSGVSSIGTGGSYCSIDEYSCQCNPKELGEVVVFQLRVVPQAVDWGRWLLGQMVTGPQWVVTVLLVRLVLVSV